MLKKIKQTMKGYSLVEILLAIAFFAMVIIAVAGSVTYGEEGTYAAGNTARATFLANEGIEAVKNIAEQNFNSLTPGTYGLSISGGQWILTGSSDTTEVFTRTVTISNADAVTKNIEAEVVWPQEPSNSLRTVTANTVITFFNRTATPTPTPTNTFTPTPTATPVTSPSVSPTPSPTPNWAAGTVEGTYARTGNQDALKIMVSGNYAYLVVNDTTANFKVIDVSNPAAPFEVGSLNLTGTPSNIFVSGSYAYVSSNNDAGEMYIIDISTPSSPSLTGSFNAAGTSDATGVYVVGTTAYLTRIISGPNPEFIIINAAIPSLPTELGSLNLPGGSPQEVVVVGTFAYLANTADGQEFQVINVSVPAVPSLAASLNLPGNNNGVTIDASGANAFVGRAGGDVVMVDITTPDAPVVLGIFAATGNTNDVSYSPASNYLFIASSNATTEFKVVDFTVPGLPVSIVTLNLGGTLNGIYYSTANDRAYGVGTDNSAELLIFRPN